MLAGLHIPLTAALGGFILLVTTLASHNADRARKWACYAGIAMLAIYLDWRIGQIGFLAERPLGEACWIGAFFVAECFGLFEFFVFLLLVSRRTDHRAFADASEKDLRAQSAEHLPEVDVWIATYNEEWPILEKTIIGALALDYPKDKLKVWVLDDGRREWLRAACAERGVGYLTRATNEHRKAGNHNNALARTSAPFILSLDADFVPFPTFIYRVLGFFTDPKIAIVQTPQSYYNSDAAMNNLRLFRLAPDDLSLFYDRIHAGRDAWGVAFYCGSCAMLRRDAIEAIGGFETATDVEDQATAVKLLAQGYTTRYFNEQLSVGLTAESISVMHDQRNRWCRGSMQIMFLPYGPFGRGLKFHERFFFLQDHWVLSAITPLFYALVPLMFWAFGWLIVPVTEPIEILAIPVLVFGIGALLVTWISGGLWLPVISPALQLFVAIELLPTALGALIKPFGKPLFKILTVTPKGSAAEMKRLDVRSFLILGAIAALTIGTMIGTLATDDVIVRDPVALSAVLFWTLYTLAVIGVAMMVCFERGYRRVEERFTFPAQGWLTCGKEQAQVAVEDLSLSGALIRSGDLKLLPGEEVSIDIPQIGRLSAGVVRVARVPDEYGVRFADPQGAVRTRLIRALFTDPLVQKVPERFNAVLILQSLFRVFAFGR